MQTDDQVTQGLNPSPTTQQPTSQPPIQTTQYAGLIVRYAAYLTDGIILGLPLYLVATLMGNLGVVSNFPRGFEPYLVIVIILWVLGYSVYFLLKYGATPGKMFFHLKVIKNDGHLPDLKAALLRESVGRILSGLPFNLGYLWVLFNKQKQGWHDKIAGTYVIQLKPASGFRKLIVVLITVLLVLPLIGIIAAFTLIWLNPTNRLKSSTGTTTVPTIREVSPSGNFPR